MTEVETPSFGEPTLLFGEPTGLLGSSSSFTSNTLVEEEKSAEEEFTLNGLLGDASNAAQDEDMSMRGAETEDERMEDVEDEDGFGAATLLGEEFTSNGLLGEASSTAGPSTQRSVTQSGGASQSQEDEFPEVRDLLAPYASKHTTATTLSRTTIPPHLSRLTIRATTFDGRAVYLKKKPKKPVTSVSSRAAETRQSIGKLLDVPIHRLLDDLSLKAASKLAIQDDQPQVPEASTSTQSSLWVDRYRPTRFTDLLGDDRVHREVMSWVKEWDHCVFGRKKGKKRARDDDNPDEYRRPREKLMLISGPPGLGKTTLAHVVAKQAGYGVYEINASDARSAQVIDDRIRPALESGTRINSSKPTLVIIDEIDGATGGGENSIGFISKLISLTYDRPKKKNRKGEAQTNRPLLRPIICICNDLYASSLAKLRPHARIIRFNRPNDFRLVKRLRDICDIEGLKAESRALTTLVGVAQGDLRGCLNTLQIIKAKNVEVTEHVVRSATVGMKEAEHSQTAVLNDLFLPMSRKRAKDLGIGEEEESRYVGRLSREIEGSGAMDKVAIGCFEHYATLRKHDSNFSRYLKANEWLSTYDILSGEMRSEREYTLLQYLPYTLVAFYPLFQERGAPKVERPKADWENYVQTQVNEEIYKSLGRCLRTAAVRHEGGYRHLASSGILQLEFAPMINRIISPPLRPVNQQIIKPDERALLARLVDIMATLELRFVQEKSEDGQLMYRLDPPIDAFVTYEAKRAADIAISRYAVRHLVATEIDARLTHHHQAEAVEKTKGNKGSFFAPKGQKDQVDEGNDVAGESQLFAGQDAAMVIKRARRDEITQEKIAVDFFGRPIVVSKKPGAKPASRKASTEKKPPGVSFKFNEGNSAAVRKPVKVSTFL